MADLLGVLRIVTSRLELSGIPYMVSGSLALGYYAQPRMTRDIDVVVELDHTQIQKVVEAFSADFYCDEDAVRRAVATRRLANLVHLESAYKVDLIVRKDSEYRQVEFQRRRRRCRGVACRTGGLAAVEAGVGPRERVRPATARRRHAGCIGPGSRLAIHLRVGIHAGCRE
jgi:hypothetical protein